MTVQEIALRVAEMVRDGELAAFAADTEAAVGSQSAASALCMAAAQAVNEVRGDFPAVSAAAVQAVNGVIDLSAIEGGVRYVVGVQKGNRRAAFEGSGATLRVGGDGEYTVYYAAEDPIAVNINMTLPDSAAVLYLTARNYCIYFGRYEQANVYDSLYTAEAERLRLKRRARLPKRLFL